MKLSEAIRMGAMLVPQEFGGDIFGKARCALKSACLAIGVDDLHTSTAFGQWPWLYEGKVICPVQKCIHEHRDDPGWTIIHLNDVHEWTREAIADWVATVEPQDIQNEQTDGGQVTHPTELSRNG